MMYFNPVFSLNILTFISSKTVNGHLTCFSRNLKIQPDTQSVALYRHLLFPIQRDSREVFKDCQRERKKRAGANVSCSALAAPAFSSLHKSFTTSSHKNQANRSHINLSH